MKQRGREAELRTGVSRTGTQVKARTVELRSGKGRVIAVVEVGFSAVDALLQHVGLHAQRETSAAPVAMQGILQGEALVRKQPDGVVGEGRPHAVFRPPEAEGQVGACPHRASRLGVAVGVGLHCTAHGELWRAPHCGGIPLRFEAPIVDEGRVLLRVHVELSRAEQQECEHETNQRGETERQTGRRADRH